GEGKRKKLGMLFESPKFGQIYYLFDSKKLAGHSWRKLRKPRAKTFHFLTPGMDSLKSKGHP
ncbi:MAG: hypothetical protein M1438_08050, partial [Deltaproteobacteria bacterium]|nr:hypothetical protein [Deltaproteobacteria bacterium]